MNKNYKYYISYSNAIYGPYEYNELEQYITSETIVCREGDDDWSYAKDMPELRNILEKILLNHNEPKKLYSKYYALIDEKEYGPYSLEQLKEFVKKNTIIRQAGGSDIEKSENPDLNKDWHPAELCEELESFFKLKDEVHIKDWFYFDDSENELGPYSKDEFDKLIEDKIITEKMLVKHINWKEPVSLCDTKLYKTRNIGNESELIEDNKNKVFFKNKKKISGLIVILFLIISAAGIYFYFNYSKNKNNIISPDHTNELNAVKPGTVQGLLPNKISNDSTILNDTTIILVQSNIDEVFGNNGGINNFIPGKLYVIFVDVGQGDGFIAITPSGKIHVIDAGTEGSEIIFYLKKLGVKQIESLVMTHPHNDHIGGIPDILKYFKVKNCYDCGAAHSSGIYRKILKMISEKKIKYQLLSGGQKLNWDKEVKIEVLHPDKKKYDNLNNYSIVFRMTYGATSVLFTGDAEDEARFKIMQKYKSQLKSTVLKAAHHGSHNGIDQNFLEAVKPEYCVISCGLNNHFGHPHNDALILMNKYKLKIFRTDFDGNIIMESDGKKEKIWADVLGYDTVHFDFKINHSVSTNFSDLKIDDNIWKIYGNKERFEYSKKGLVISAEPFENIYNYSKKTVLLIKKRPENQNTISIIRMKGSEFESTDGAILAYYDMKNWISLSCAEGKMISLTNSVKGKYEIEYFKFFNVPKYYAVEIHGNNINFAVSEDKSNWFIIKRYESKEIGFKPSSAKIGLSSNSWHKQNKSKSIFFNYSEYVTR